MAHTNQEGKYINKEGGILMYKIIGKYCGEAEEIDEFETREEAMQMLTEYRMAYGSEWKLWIKKS